MLSKLVLAGLVLLGVMFALSVATPPYYHYNYYRPPPVVYGPPPPVHYGGYGKTWQSFCNITVLMDLVTFDNHIKHLINEYI